MSLLPTVRSRCKIIRLGPDKRQDGKADIMNDFPFDKRAGERILWLYGKLSGLAGKKLSPYWGSIGRETGLGFIEKVIEEIRNEPSFAQALRKGRILDEAAKAHQRLKQNINPMLVLQEFVLNM